ncbi:MAG: tetratricopeptide repeat protein [Ottowia sp.]|nr:tetratricopeptide repeat protein [Ottowia sp.]
MKFLEGGKSVFLVAFALAACALAMYARALGYAYVWDDLSYLEGFLQYRGLEGVIRALAEPFFLYPDYYRPLAMLSFVLSREPWAQHAINVVLHALNTVLVFQCARALMPMNAAPGRLGLVAAACGALFFAVHPVAVEPTVWVSGRFDTLACSFVLGACLATFAGELTRKRLALVCVLFFAAMCSKEPAAGLLVALPLLLLLKWRLAGEEAGVREMLRRLVPLLGVLALAMALYVAARLAAMSHLFGGDAPAVFQSDRFVDKFNIAALAVTAFVKLIVNPWSHSAPLHPFTYEVGSGVLANTLVVLGCVLALLVLAALKNPRLNFPLALLAALAMVSPALHLVSFPNVGVIISDRYALAPLALLLAALSATVGAWLARRVPAMGAGERRVLVYAGVFGLLWAGALAAHSNVTIPMWRNDIVLWTFTHARVPESSAAHKSYIATLMDRNMWSEADAEVKKFMSRFPGEGHDLLSIRNHMVIRAKVGDYQGMLALFDSVDRNLLAVEETRHPRQVGFFYGTRGQIESEAGYWEQALHYLQKALQVSPGDLELSFWYARALHMTGQPEKADKVFKRALAGSTKDMADWAVAWRRTWRPPEDAHKKDGLMQGAADAK